MKVADLIASRRDVYFIAKTPPYMTPLAICARSKCAPSVCATSRAFSWESCRKAMFPIKSLPKISVPPGCVFPKS